MRALLGFALEHVLDVGDVEGAVRLQVLPHYQKLAHAERTEARGKGSAGKCRVLDEGCRARAGGIDQRVERREPVVGEHSRHHGGGEHGAADLNAAQRPRRRDHVPRDVAELEHRAADITAKVFAQMAR
jgi:hypothetical protein